MKRDRIEWKEKLAGILKKGQKSKRRGRLGGWKEVLFPSYSFSCKEFEEDTYGVLPFYSLLYIYYYHGRSANHTKKQCGGIYQRVSVL